jgi:hypothetical protein
MLLLLFRQKSQYQPMSWTTKFNGVVVELSTHQMHQALVPVDRTLLVSWQSPPQATKQVPDSGVQLMRAAHSLFHFGIPWFLYCSQFLHSHI